MAPRLLLLGSLRALAEQDATGGCHARIPAVPDTATELNGVAWPKGCYEGKDKYHVFILGDWGGMCGYGEQNDCTLSPEDAQAKWDMKEHPFRPYPMANNRGTQPGTVDDFAQLAVRDRMNQLAAKVDPEFVLNVGDSFYPGGIVEHCLGRRESVDFNKVPHQFQTTYEDIYNGTGLRNKEWMSVLGNHDYGGVCYNMGWPQQIWYTWNQASSKRWIMPGQYYSRQARFQTSSGPVTMDMWFLDTNIEDVNKDPNHDICSTNGNTHNENAGPQSDGWYCKGFLGDWQKHEKNGVCEGLPYNGPDSCKSTFKSLWHEQIPWLEKGLRESKADWQVIVTHFPAYYPAIARVLKPLAHKYGVDVIVTGHTHEQALFYKRPAYGQDWLGTAIVVSGGGGGIFSEGTPRANGHDNSYGFMDMAVSKESIEISSYSWATENQVLRVEIGDADLGDQVELGSDPKCCWGNYWGCEKWPGGGGRCLDQWDKQCSNDIDCGAPGPAPGPGPKLSDCSGKYTPTQWTHNGHQRFSGGKGGKCMIYWDTQEGWVLNSNQDTNAWVCRGGKTYDMPSGTWTKKHGSNGARDCKVSVSEGDMIRMLHAEVAPVAPMPYYNDTLMV